MTAHPTSRSLLRRGAALLTIVVLLLQGTAALASQLPEQPAEDQQVPREGAHPLEISDTSNRVFWPWAAGDRMLSLGRKGTNPGRWEQLVAHDLATGKEAQRLTLPVPVPDGADMATPQSHLGTVDEAGARMFLATMAPAPYVVFNNNRLTEPQVKGTETAGQGSACAGAAVSCFGGVQVVDLARMEVTRTIPFRSVQIDGFVGQPVLRAMSYSPPRGPEDGAKLYYVIEERALFPVQFEGMARLMGGNLFWVVQTDADSGVQEWALRVDTCRYAREPNSGGDLSATIGLPNAAAVFRAASLTDPSVWVGCHSSSAQAGTVVRVPLDDTGAPATLPARPAEPTALAGGVAESQAAPQGPMVTTDGALETYTGPDRVVEIAADPASERMVMKVVAGTPKAEVWWVFDGHKREFVGTVGIGKYDFQSATVNALDRTTGRLYVLAGESAGFSGGLLVSDVRRSPLQQPLVFPQFARVERLTRDERGMVVVPGVDGRPARLYYRATAGRLDVIEDRLPLGGSLPLDEFGGRTLDLEEIEGITAAAFDGAARGYGLRALFVGGYEAIGRVGPVDPSQVEGVQHSEFFRGSGAGTLQLLGVQMPLFSNPCATTDREVLVGSVGPDEPVILDGGGARGVAQPVVFDSSLRADAEAPASRCSPRGDWADLWTAGLFGRPPVEEPAPEWPLADSQASCTASEEQSQSDRWGDPVAGALSAQVSCTPDEAAGWSQARSVGVDTVNVAEASSSYRVYRDPGRGLVARVESLTRGVGIDGVIRIESVRGVAEAWANGRRQPVDPADREAGYDPNCDFERTAGTCFRTTLSGVHTREFRCDVCKEQGRVIEALNKALGNNGRARMRRPDARLAKGAENGYIAAVQKPDHERFADMTLNTDLLQTVVPALEIIRYAPSYQVPAVGVAARPGRQIFQFAGVEVSTSYGINCLLVYDEATNTCAEAKEPPGALTVSLADTAGKPLAGGAFEIRADVDADGVLGLKDTLLPNGACVTAADGVGTCRFESLQPGTYLVSQIAAPPGYAKFDKASVVDIASDEAVKLDVVNASNVAVIDVKATDEAGAPLAGATFAAYPDPDADGRVAADAKPAGSCTTAADGTCRVAVPAGSYVLVQTAAPGGLEGIEPVAFTVAGGQTAAVGVVNYPPAGPAAPEPAPAPDVSYEAPPAPPEPETSVDVYEPPTLVDEVPLPDVSVPEAIGGTVVRVIRAPGDAMRLLARDPMEAVAWIASLALFVLAVGVVRRRLQVTDTLVDSG